MAEKLLTPAPVNNLAGELASRVSTRIGQVAAQVIIDHGSPKEIQPLSGAITLDGKEFSYMFTMVNSPGHSGTVARLGPVLPKSVKDFTYSSASKMVSGEESEKDGPLKGKENWVSYGFKYEAGKKGEVPSGFLPAVRSELVIAKEGNLIKHAFQIADLTNRHIGDPQLVGVFTGDEGQGNFQFTMALELKTGIKGGNLRGIVVQRFAPSVKEDGSVQYQGELAEKDVKFTPDDAEVAKKRGRAESFNSFSDKLSLAAGQMPTHFTVEEIVAMLTNIASGQVFIKDVWNPLLIPTARRTKS